MKVGGGLERTLLLTAAFPVTHGRDSINFPKHAHLASNHRP